MMPASSVSHFCVDEIRSPSWLATDSIADRGPVVSTEVEVAGALLCGEVIRSGTSADAITIFGIVLKIALGIAGAGAEVAPVLLNAISFEPIAFEA